MAFGAPGIGYRFNQHLETLRVRRGCQGNSAERDAQAQVLEKDYKTGPPLAGSQKGTRMAELFHAAKKPARVDQGNRKLQANIE